MGLHMHNNAIATGRAKCKVCDQIIKKGMRCIYVSGWRTGGHCHKNCRKVNMKELVRERLLDKIDMWFNNESVMTAEDYDNLMIQAEDEAEILIRGE